MNDTNPDDIKCGGLIAGDSDEPVIVVDGRRYTENVIRRLRMAHDHLQAERDAVAAQNAAFREAMELFPSASLWQAQTVWISADDLVQFDEATRKALASPSPRAEAMLAVVDAARAVGNDRPLSLGPLRDALAKLDGEGE